jgi:GT2 family glycosyltransferase
MGEMNKKIGVIIPLHEYNDEVKALLTKAIDSVPQELNIFISTNEEIDNKINEITILYPNNVTLIQHNVDSSFSNLVSVAVKFLEDDGYEYFSILEFDDIYSEIWYKNVIEEIEDKPEVSVFLPFTEILDFESKRFISYGNEAPWASSFSEEIGYIDNESLQQYFDFYLTGSIFNIKDWNYVGGLKTSMKITFWYEFLLRLTHNDKKAYVIPKLIYKHYVNRPNSLYKEYKEQIDEKEVQFWYDTAIEEYRYKKDRNKKYIQE